MIKNINIIRKLSILIFILPILAVNLCLVIVINFHEILPAGGGIGFTIPYIDGGTSISRTARIFPTYLIFKPVMILTAILLIIYWKNTSELMKKVDPDLKYNNYFLFFGIISAIFLILHSVFLGIKFDNSLYKIFRRFIILSFVIFELCAQGFLVANLQKIKNKITNIISKKVLLIKTILITTLSLVALASAPILVSSGFVYFKHALEWNYFIAIISFYILSYFLWKEPSVHTPEGV